MISLDTLDPFKFEIMTRRPGHDAVLRSLSAALHSQGLRSVKLNVVIIKGLNDSEVLDFVKLTTDQNISVRFIEFMPFTGILCPRKSLALLTLPQETSEIRQKWSLPASFWTLSQENILP